ncbi:hypothetical protein SLE2022_163350 [Rubroshorea leprosula]
MEKISAACAMEWSIQLEKALRSKNRARAIEAILETVSRLKRWSQEPEAKQAVCSMFSLVPGEDRLFANTILLRLADAFRVGDREIRKSIVIVFLSNHRQRRRNELKKGIKGILSKGRVQNHVELLSRVKAVFETGDVESRALALILFGCWADFAKDSAEIRYLVLSSMVSSSVPEVKASFFAAGCFCELVDDFAFVVLEMLVNIMSMLATAEAMRLSGARVFANMTCSHSVATKAFKTGLQLVSDSSEEKFIVAFMVSLTKLACKSTTLISKQVDLLFLYLKKESWKLRAIALKCLHFIFVKQKLLPPVTECLIKTLFSTLEESELSPGMQCQALQVLHKIILFKLHDVPSLNMLDITQLLAIVEIVSQSTIISNSLCAFSFLADISSKLWESTETGYIDRSFSHQPSKVISLIIKQIISVVKPFHGLCEINSTVFQEVKVLLKLLLKMVGENPDLGVLVLDKIVSFIDYIVGLHGNEVATGQTGMDEIVKFEGAKRKVISKILYYINRFVVACLQNLNDVASITVDISNKVKFLVDHLHQHGLFDFYIRTTYISVLNAHIVSHSMVNENKETISVDGISALSFPSYLLEHEFVIHEHAKKMLTEGDYWPAYKAGIHAATEGAWLIATFIFEQLVNKVKSDSYYSWLKSLVLFSHSEGKVRLFLLTNQQSNFVDILKLEKSPFKDNLGAVNHDAVGITNEPGYIEVLVEAQGSLCSSVELLEKIDISGKEFCFQRWFLALRAKVLSTIVEVLKISGTSKWENVDNDGDFEKRILIEPIPLQKITQISFQLKMIAKEFDLMSTSFIGMDGDTSNIIAALALSCSVLAFTSGFPLFFPSLLAYETLTNFNPENSQQNYSCSMLLQHMVGRLSHIDNETGMKIGLLFEGGAGDLQKCLHLHFRNQILSCGHEVRDVLSVLKYAVSGMVCLRNEVNKIQNEEIVSHVTKKGLQLLLEVVGQWINIPFQVPRHFFKIRPCIGSELFAFNADAKNSNEITVIQGSTISLNLCLQLRNMPSEFPLRLSRMYCILCCRVSSFQKPCQNERNGETVQWDSRPWENEDMVEMNENLFCYVTECTKKANPRKCSRDNIVNKDCGIVHSYVCFEPNVKGQGFSSCLLDVSHFPVGCYTIKWFSCCIDRQGSYWSLLPLNSGPEFLVQQSPVS